MQPSYQAFNAARQFLTFAETFYAVFIRRRVSVRSDMLRETTICVRNSRPRESQNCTSAVRLKNLSTAPYKPLSLEGDKDMRLTQRECF